MPFEPIQNAPKATFDQKQGLWVVPKVGSAVNLEDTAKVSGAEKKGSLTGEEQFQESKGKDFQSRFNNFMGSGKNALDMKVEDYIKLFNGRVDEATQFKQFTDKFKEGFKNDNKKMVYDAAVGSVQLLSNLARKIPYNSGPSSFVTQASTSLKSSLRMQPYKNVFDKMLEASAPFVRSFAEPSGRFSENDMKATIKSLEHLASPELRERAIATEFLAQQFQKANPEGVKPEFDSVDYNNLAKRNPKQLLEIKQYLEALNQPQINKEVQQ